MDAKLTLSFDQTVVERAKKYAAENNISLSRLVEHLLTQVTSKQYKSLDDFPISDWVSMVAEGEAEYKRNPSKLSKKSARKDLTDEFFSAKKPK